ncbi:MAG: hypothetical protein ABI779_24000 [Acidobacteriota bacterium]
MRKSALLLLALCLVLPLFADDAVIPTGPLTRVEAKMVCMVNEQNMGKEQIPVEVEGRTYYGCCEMCKKALADNAAKRTATDPISGKQVDKATAVIAAQQDGRVFYFENEQNLAKHNALYKQ